VSTSRRNDDGRLKGIFYARAIALFSGRARETFFLSPSFFLSFSVFSFSFSFIGEKFFIAVT